MKTLFALAFGLMLSSAVVAAEYSPDRYPTSGAFSEPNYAAIEQFTEEYLANNPGEDRVLELPDTAAEPYGI